MGYFLEKTWLWWLLAIVIAVLITWLIFWWRSRRAARGDDGSTAELTRLRSAAEAHDRELQELRTERDAAQQQLAALQAKHAGCPRSADGRAAVLPTQTERVTGEFPKVSE
jgi:type VI protein secretion system component VasK